MSDSDHRAGLDARRGGSDAHLVLARPSDPGADAYCRNRLAADAHPGSVPITVLTDPESRGPSPGSGADDAPEVVVVVGDGVRGSATVSPEATDAGSSSTTVSAPGDLGAVGRTVDDFLITWYERGRRPVVCVDSLNGLLEHASIHGTYRFLYVLRRRIDDVDGEIHVHVDPSAHEEEILRTFFAVFDRVVAFEDDGPPLL